MRGAYIAYDGPSGSVGEPDHIDAILYFNVSGAGKYCTLLHYDSNKPRRGLYFGREFNQKWGDPGDGVIGSWGALNASTFMIRREDAISSTEILGKGTQYAIACF